MHGVFTAEIHHGGDALYTLLKESRIMEVQCIVHSGLASIVACMSLEYQHAYSETLLSRTLPVSVLRKWYRSG